MSLLCVAIVIRNHHNVFVPHVLIQLCSYELTVDHVGKALTECVRTYLDFKCVDRSDNLTIALFMRQLHSNKLTDVDKNVYDVNKKMKKKRE